MVIVPVVYTTGRIDIIDKFPFASDDNATDVGDLDRGKNANSGQSSTAHGYSSGGYEYGSVNSSKSFLSRLTLTLQM